MLTLMMSPTLAYRRFEPPSTLMQRTDLAPVLSATSNRDSVWIISIFPTCTRRQQPQRTSQGLQISQSVLGPSSAPQTICSTSRWAETSRRKREALDYCKRLLRSQAPHQAGTCKYC